jgi:thiol-disulfide isomerase/thioredoxin
MRVCRLRPGTVAVGLIFLVTIGCSSEEEAPLDPGVSPFYPGPGGSTKASTNPNTVGGPIAGGTGAAGTPADRAGAAPASLPESEEPIPPEDIERHLRIAVSTADKGDTARAARTLDRILAMQPLNREALLRRASIALAESEKATVTGEKAAALEKAGVLIRAVRRAFEKPTKAEIMLYARVLYLQTQAYATQGQHAKAVAVLREAYEGGIDAYDQIESDKAMASFRTSPEYRTLVKTIDDEELAAARLEVKNNLDKPLDFSFDFKLNDINGKPLSLDQLKGKVVLVDIWGTWCKPCREAIPGLVQLYRKHHRRGLEIVGFAFEQTPNPEEALAMVKQAVQGAGIPYHCALGDESIRKQIPNFNSFPTTLVLDRSGKVRVLVTENTKELLGVLDSVVRVLAVEPTSPVPVKPADAKPADAKPADAKPAAKPH